MDDGNNDDDDDDNDNNILKEETIYVRIRSCAHFASRFPCR